MLNLKFKYVTLINLLTASIISVSIAMVSFKTNANTSLPKNRHIAVTGQAKLEVEPDVAVIHLQLESTQKESLAAKQNIDTRVNTLLDGLSRFSVDENNISASSISIQPRYVYHNNQQVLDGYQAQRTLKVTLTKLKLLNDFLDFCLETKINQIRHIELKSSQAEQHQKSVSELAIKNATSNAEQLAIAFSAKLGPIYSINSGNNNIAPQYGANRAIEMSFKSSRGDVGARPGKYLQEKLIFSASINAVFDLHLN